MENQYIDARNKKIEEINLKPAVAALEKGNLVIMPTETVYGIGADGLKEEACQKIFQAKGRKQDNPLILHVSNMEMIEQIANINCPEEKRLIQHFMPGPFTIILEKKSCVPDAVCCKKPTVGVRMPSDEIAHQLICELGRPIAAPSANLSGKPSGTILTEIDEDLRNQVSVLIDGGPSKIGVESTVVKVEAGTVIILRPGKITLEEIKQVCPKVELSSHLFEKIEENETVESPGMKYRHYAPKTRCKLVYSKMQDRMKEAILEEAKKAGKVLILAHTEDVKFFQEKGFAVLDLGARENLEEIMRNLFSSLRKVDDFDADLVLIEGVKKEGLGVAIMNRLIRACSYEYMEI